MRIRKVLLCHSIDDYTLLEDKTFPANLRGPPQPHKAPSLGDFRLLIIRVSTFIAFGGKSKYTQRIQYIQLCSYTCSSGPAMLGATIRLIVNKVENILYSKVWVTVGDNLSKCLRY